MDGALQPSYNDCASLDLWLYLVQSDPFSRPLTLWLYGSQHDYILLTKALLWYNTIPMTAHLIISINELDFRSPTVAQKGWSLLERKENPHPVLLKTKTERAAAYAAEASIVSSFVALVSSETRKENIKTHTETVIRWASLLD